MSAASQSERYHGHYPGFAQLAILCEGDVVGYEKDALEKWLSDHNRLYVDVWPCGTAESLIGFCDSIGRSVKVAVIQDRDYRDVDEANSNCEGNKRKRATRGVDIAFWRAWRRHEIENYFIEPRLLALALIGVFPISESTLLDRLADVIRAQAIDQAAQWTLYQARESFPSGYEIYSGLSRKTERPRWNVTSQQHEIPPAGTVKDGLKRILDAAMVTTKKLYDSPKKPVDEMIASFEGKHREWSTITLEDAAWRVDWSGKEILQGLYEVLASVHGFRKRTEGGTPSPDEYVKLSPNAGPDRAAALRHIEWAIQPALVGAFLSDLRNTDSGDVFMEWCEIAEGFKS